MYGFKPRHAQGKPVQNLADGGIVHSLTGMLGMRKRTPEEMLAADAKVQERNREAAARVAARAKPAQQAAPAEEKAVSSYAGMSAMQRREKELGLKDGGIVGGFKPGGLIRGPGTGTSDSIATEKRPGTFIMPADSTQAIGPEALQSLGAPKGMPEAEGMEEPGDMDDRDEPEGEKVPVRLSNGEFELPPEQVQALGEAVLTVMRDATHQPAGEQKKAHTGKGFTPHQFFSGGGTVQDFMPGTRAVFNESGKAIGDLANQGRYAAAAGETARAALAYVPAVVDDVVGGAVRAVGPALADAGKQFLGMNEAPAPVKTTQDGKFDEKRVNANNPAAPAPDVPPAQSAPQQSAFDANPPPADTPPADTPSTTGQQVMPGVYQHGRGQYSDNATGMGMPANFTGQPNAQNMAAADALVARQTPAGFQPAGSQPAGVQAPVVRNSTNDWAARKALENMATAASSITNRPEWQSGSTTIAGSTRGPNGAGDPEGKVAAYKAALANDLALQQAQPNMEQAAMRENGANQRATLQDQSATARTVIQEQGSNARDARRNELTAEELGLRREAQGFQTRDAAQRENLRNTLIDPKATPEQRKQAQEYLQALAVSDKEPSPQYKSYVMPATRNADGSTTEGGVYQENTRTGEGRWVKPQGDGQAPQALPKAGEVRNGYRFKGGNPNDQVNWTKV